MWLYTFGYPDARLWHGLESLWLDFGWFGLLDILHAAGRSEP